MNTTNRNKVSVAVIDSGVNPEHPHVGPIEGGCAFRTDNNGNVVMDAGHTDEIGHGTAVAALIRGYSPAARIHAFKIFGDRLSADAALLLKALEWAISQPIRIIQLSLGTFLEQHRSMLADLCNQAWRRNTIVVASARTAEDAVYPAVFGSVIGVYWDLDCPPDKLIFRPDKPVHFGAHGWPRPIPGMDQRNNFRGGSFAAAHVAGRIARMLETSPGLSPAQAVQNLIRQASLSRFPTGSSNAGSNHPP